MITPNESSPRWPQFVLLAVALTFLAHAPFALLEGPFQDGWIHELLFDRGDRATVLRLLLDNGRPVAGYLNLWAMDLAGSGHGAVWMSVASLCVCAAAWCLVWLRMGFASGPLCAAMATVCAVSPANQIILGAPTVIWVTAHALFAIGLWMYLRSLASPSPGAWAWTGGATVFAVLAASVGESTAVMLLLYPAFAWMSRHQMTGWPGRGGTNIPFVVRAALPVGAGLCAFVVMFFTFPPVGVGFVTERRISLNPLNIAVSAASFGITLLVAYLPVWLVLWQQRRVEGQLTGRDARAWLAMALASVVLICGPYIAAMRLASPVGWGGRYLYYAGAALAWLFPWALGRRGADGRIAVSRQGLLMIVAAVLACLLVRWPAFAVRVVHQDALGSAVARVDLARTADIIVVEDQTPVMAGPLRDVEWTGLLQRALKRPGTLAAFAMPQADPRGWDAWRLQIRRYLGWAAQQTAAFDARLIRETLDSLESHGALVQVNREACRIAIVRVAAPPAYWYPQALGWYLQSRLGSRGDYEQWLAESIQGRISAERLAGAPCR